MMTVDKTLSLGTKASFALGHILNDLTASLWFTYTLLYFHNVLNLNNSYTGLVLLSSHLSDAVGTLLVGGLADKSACLSVFSRYGKRKSWHLIGTVCTLASLPFIFLPCQGCSSSPAWIQLLYYTSFTCLYSFAWACIQISHLSLIPEVASSQDERTGLTAVRYTMTVLSTISVYLLAWGLLGAGHADQQITSADQDRFRNLMLVVVGLGGAASLAFHLSFEEKTNEKLLPAQCESLNRPEATVPMSVKDWLLEPQFYQVAVAYISSSLFVNLSQSYVPLYIQVSLHLPATLVAIAPFVMYLAGFVISLVMKPLMLVGGLKLTYFLGAVLGLVSSLIIYYGTGDSYEKYGVVCLAAGMGVSGTTLVVASQSLIAELIASNTESSSFVYGAITFTDKLANGGIIMLIQYIANDAEETVFFRVVLSCVTGAAALMGAYVVITLAPVTVGDRWRDKKRDANETTPLLA